MKNGTPRKTINVDKPNRQTIYGFKELDNAVLRLSLYKNSIPFDVEGQTIRLGAKTSKGIIEQVDGFTINANELDIELKNSILVPGVVEIDLELKDANGIMTTASFFITVESRVLNDTAVQSTNEFDTFSKTVAKVEEDYNSLRRIIIDENQAANLQDQVNKTNAQLDNIATISVDQFGAVGDFNKDTLTGADDTEAFKKAFKYAEDNKINRIVLNPNKKYKLSNRVITKKSNIEVDAMGSTIYWYNPNNVVNKFPTVRESWIGALEFVGERLEDTKVNITNYETVEEKLYEISTSMTIMGKWCLSSATKYEVGDNIYISIPTKAPSSYDVGIPLCYTHCKILKIDGQYIYTDFYSPYENLWGNRVFDDNDYCIKLKPIKNVTVKNINFEDLNPHTQLDFLEPNVSDVNKQVSGLTFNYAENISVENYKATGIHYSGLETYGARIVNIKNININDAKYNGAGKGYGVHFYHSNNIVVDNFHCQNTRHTIDFSSSSFATVTNCSGSGHEEYSFTLHGECEHNITYINCKGWSYVNILDTKSQTFLCCTSS